MRTPFRFTVALSLAEKLRIEVAGRVDTVGDDSCDGNPRDHRRDVLTAATTSVIVRFASLP